MRVLTQTLIADDVWGGEEILLVVGETSSTLEYVCAAGEIIGKLVLDEGDNFIASGVHINRTPGPTYVDRSPERRPAFYTGQISGSLMTLRVTLSDTNELVGDFTLERGKVVRIRRCL